MAEDKMERPRPNIEQEGWLDRNANRLILTALLLSPLLIAALVAFAVWLGEFVADAGGNGLIQFLGVR